MAQPTKLLAQGIDILRQRGVKDFTLRGALYAYESALRAYHGLTGKTDAGENVYDREWDVLVILDACRPDLMEQVAPEYDFVGEVDRFQSVSSYSLGWMEKTFAPERAAEMKNTVYVTSNPFSKQILSTDQFLSLDEVWSYAWDDEVSSVPPRPVTDRAVHAARKHNPDRLIVHYMQPHIPFITHPELHFSSKSPEEWGAADGMTIWDRVRYGDIPFETMWEAYLDNLRVVLDDVALLRENVDADKMVLTADHGNAVGERGLYGHPRGIATKSLREVPWVETTGQDSGTFEPGEYEQLDDTDVSDKLRHLGYL